MKGRQQHHKRSGRSRTPAKSSTTLTLPRTSGIALLALSLVGLIVSMYLTYVQHRLRAEPGWQSACAISDLVNCDTVVLSPYGSVAGLPLSSLGAWFYGATAAVVLVGLRKQRPRFPRSPAIVLLFAAVAAVAVSAGLATISWAIIGSFCVFCASLYALNFAMLVLAWRAARRTGEPIGGSLVRELGFWREHPSRPITWLAVSVIAALLLHFVETRKGPAPSEICAAVAAIRADAQGSRSIPIVVYSDFQCPGCKALDLALRPLRHNPALRFEIRDYPLDGACNPYVKHSRHPGACLQALAGICADEQKDGAAFRDRLFDEGLKEREGILDLAVSVGLDRDTFGACLGSQDSKKRLDDSMRAASLDNVKATPTLIVNGQPHVGRLSDGDLSCLAGAGSERPTR